MARLNQSDTHLIAEALFGRVFGNSFKITDPKEAARVAIQWASEFTVILNEHITNGEKSETERLKEENKVKDAELARLRAQGEKAEAKAKADSEKLKARTEAEKPNGLKAKDEDEKPADLKDLNPKANKGGGKPAPVPASKPSPAAAATQAKVEIGRAHV